MSWPATGTIRCTWNVDALPALWDEGLSTAEIARRLGVTKNAICGKAHRLDLPARTSPIRAAGDRSPYRRRAPLLVTLPPLPSLAAAPPPKAVKPPRKVPKARPVARPVMRPPSPPPAPPPRYVRVAPCCWPIGHPGTPGFRFCGDPGAPASPYCATHHAVARRPFRDLREAAA